MGWQQIISISSAFQLFLSTDFSEVSWANHRIIIEVTKGLGWTDGTALTQAFLFDLDKGGNSSEQWKDGPCTGILCSHVIVFSPAHVVRAVTQPSQLPLLRTLLSRLIRKLPTSFSHSCMATSDLGVGIHALLASCSIEGTVQTTK